MKKTKCFYRPFRPDVDFYKLLFPVKILLLLLIFMSQPVLSSGFDEDLQLRITGTVTDAKSGTPLPGVNVAIKGTTIGAITDATGKYSVTSETKDAVLVFSFIGYVTQEITATASGVVDIVLSEQVTGLDEVVVVGYTTQKRANVVGSVTSLSGESLQGIPAASVSNAISGRLPGTVVIAASGEPGQDVNPRILVRGRSTLGGSRTSASQTNPLIVIDGVQGRSMSEIDPMDIASFSVLKDASAAIYGSNAANGVILITTKKGQEGKPRLNYQFYQGFMTPSIIPDVTNATEYATMLSEYQTAIGRTRTYSDRDIELFASGEDP